MLRENIIVETIESVETTRRRVYDEQGRNPGVAKRGPCVGGWGGKRLPQFAEKRGAKKGMGK